MKKIKEILIFNNGNLVVSDENNEQIVDLQRKNIFFSLLDEYEQKGYDISDVSIIFNSNQITISKSKHGVRELKLI